MEIAARLVLRPTATPHATGNSNGFSLSQCSALVASIESDNCVYVSRSYELGCSTEVLISLWNFQDRSQTYAFPNRAALHKVETKAEKSSLPERLWAARSGRRSRHGLVLLFIPIAPGDKRKNWRGHANSSSPISWTPRLGLRLVLSAVRSAAGLERMPPAKRARCFE